MFWKLKTLCFENVLGYLTVSNIYQTHLSIGLCAITSFPLCVLVFFICPMLSQMSSWIKEMYTWSNYSDPYLLMSLRHCFSQNIHFPCYKTPSNFKEVNIKCLIQLHPPILCLVSKRKCLVRGKNTNCKDMW